MSEQSGSTPAPIATPIVVQENVRPFRPAHMIQAVLEQAASQQAATPQEAPQAESTPAPAASEQSEAPAVEVVAEAPVETSATRRKEYLAQQKRNRELTAENKRLRLQAEEATNAPKIQVDWRQDPIAVAKELGADPYEFYKAQTDHFLKTQQPEDAVAKRVKEEVTPYILALEEEKARVQVERDLQGEAQAVREKVLPLFSGDSADRFECLLLIHNNDKTAAALQIYIEVRNHWMKTGEKLSFEEVASTIDAQYEKLLEDGHKAVSSSKRFTKKFSQPQGSTASLSKPEQSFQKAPTRTLTNAINPSVKGQPPASLGNSNKPLTREERIANAIAESKTSR